MFIDKDGRSKEARLRSTTGSTDHDTRPSETTERTYLGGDTDTLPAWVSRSRSPVTSLVRIRTLYSDWTGSVRDRHTGPY